MLIRVAEVSIKTTARCHGAAEGRLPENTPLVVLFIQITLSILLEKIISLHTTIQDQCNWNQTGLLNEGANNASYSAGSFYGVPFLPTQVSKVLAQGFDGFAIPELVHERCAAFIIVGSSLTTELLWYLQNCSFYLHDDYTHWETIQPLQRNDGSRGQQISKSILTVSLTMLFNMVPEK